MFNYRCNYYKTIKFLSRSLRMFYCVYNSKLPRCTKYWLREMTCEYKQDSIGDCLSAITASGLQRNRYGVSKETVHPLPRFGTSSLLERHRAAFPSYARFSAEMSAIMQHGSPLQQPGLNNCNF